MERDDEFFGRLVYMKMPEGRVSYWEATCFFEPAGREIELFIDAPAPLAAPNEHQRGFYEQVKRDYRDILRSVEPLLRSELERWTGSAMSDSLDGEFSLSSFSIPVPSDAAFEWEMSFDSASDPEHLFSVAFRGLEPRSVTVDG